MLQQSVTTFVPGARRQRPHFSSPWPSSSSPFSLRTSTVGAEPYNKTSLVDSVADRLKPMKTGDIFRDHPLAMKNHLGPLLLCATALNFAGGCSNPYSAHPLSADQPVSSKAAPYAPKKTQIISEPAGARIEINDNYVGDAPITVELAQRGDYFDEDTVVRAIPTEGGDYTQTKRFLTNDPWHHPGSAGDKIPSRIFFNMHLVPTTPTTR